MKIAITGKGGVGKTTLAGLLARGLARQGIKVLAVDADPDANLAGAIGLPAERAAELVPFSQMKSLAKERTGANGSGLFKLNPSVADLPERFALEHQGVKLLKMGSVEQAGGGCVCPEHTLLRALMRQLLVKGDEWVVMDMEAGIEHLGRGTAEAVDMLLVVVEPGQRSLQTAEQAETLARELGIARVAFVAGKVQGEEDLAFIRQRLGPGRKLLGHLSWSEALRAADRQGLAPFDCQGPFVAQAAAIQSQLQQELIHV
ncbi:AAA family ATPase [Ferrimonas futtsuensis]|uniref:ATP-binding protein n=1 Tax=Ferrimonas futtsuensis TaxID=364764 RepID=UPI0004075886|nr:AAA family ATPase [Ferrimonas futtsuensis]